MPEKIFSECVVCRHWSSKNKMGRDGEYYCTIHFQKEQDKPISNKRADKARKNIEFFRAVKEVNIE